MKKLKVKILISDDILSKSPSKKLTMVIAAILNTFENKGLPLDKGVYRPLSDVTASIDAMLQNTEASALERVSSSQNRLKLIPRMNTFLKSACDSHDIKKIVLTIEIPEWVEDEVTQEFINNLEFKRLKLKMKKVSV